MPKTPPYSEEFRREAVQLLRTSGRSVPQLAKELGVSQGSLRNWASQRDVDEGKTEGGLSSAERDELRRLRRELRVVTEEREILKKSGCLLRQGQRDPVSVFTFIAAKKAEHSITLMGRGLEVSRSSFHAWAVRAPSARAVADRALSGRIAEIHTDSLKTYGSPRVHAELRLEDGIQVGRKRVERLMRRAGLSGQITRPAWEDDDQRPGRPHGARSRRARLQPDRAEPLVVRGHHLHPDVGGVAVSGVGDGLL
jgi:transposase-like protein